MNDPYRTTDRMIARLNRKTVRRFERAKTKMKLAKFDELNVLKTVRGLYEDLDEDARELLLTLAIDVYNETEMHGEDEPDRKWLLALLSEPSAVTGYIYKNEVGRKRDYLIESLSTGTNRDANIRKAMSYWARMMAQYADNITEAAVIKALRDAGLDEVRWHTRDDEKVCKVCDKRHNRIYPINRIPDRPHWGCRCWWEPVV